MIGKIKGKLIEVESNIGLIETNSGISYLVHLTPSAISQTTLNSFINIYTYLQIREDAHVLFGFQTKSEHSFFKLLLNVPGVGPKTAFLVVSFSKVDNLIKAIQDNNIEFFIQIPRLGKKTSMKIILELSQRLKSDFQINSMYLSNDDKVVVDALVSLGFKAIEARKQLSKLPKNLSIEEKIHLIIKRQI